jgi:hypothetical protein
LSFGGFAFAILHAKTKKKENYGIFFLETERRKCVTRVLQRMVGGKLLRGKKGFGRGGRDDDDDPRPRGAFLLSLDQTMSTGQTLNLPELPNVPLLSTGRRPSFSRNSRSPNIVHRTETFFPPKVPVMSTGRTVPLPPESPGIARRTETFFLLPELTPSPGFLELCGARHRSSSGKSSGGHETSRVCI